MPTTCANCRAEVGDAAFCPQCGRAVLSPQSADQSERASASGDRGRSHRHRRAARCPLPVEPAPAASTPGPVRFPLYADELDVAAHSQPPAEHPGHDDPPRRSGSRHRRPTTTMTTTAAAGAVQPGCPG